MQPTDSPSRPNLEMELFQQCNAMATYALKQGKPVPGDIIDTLASVERIRPLDLVLNTPNTLSDAKQLASVHERLTQIVAPASPVTIQLFDKEAAQGGMWKFLGPVPLVRRFMSLAGIFLLFILAISISPDLNDGKSADMFESNGWPLLINELFLICAAGLGATFAALFQLNPYITNCTYDPKYEPSYWIKFVLGLIAGFMLSELIDLHPAPTRGESLARPVLAMVGGFSATVVYRILSRLTETVESLFQGSMKETILAREQAAQTRAAQQMNQDRLRLATSLIEIQKVAVAGSSEAIRQKLDEALANLIPVEFRNNTSSGPTSVGLATETDSRSAVSTVVN